MSDLAAEGYPLVMLVSDLCRLLRIHENTLYLRIKSGRDVPPWTRTAGTRGRYEWNRAAVQRWLDQRHRLKRA